MTSTDGRNYQWALPLLPPRVQGVVEVGSRDGLDALFLGQALSTHVDAFEPSPSQFAVCRRNVDSSGADSVRLHQYALCDVDSFLDFWEVDDQQYANPGASSLFPINFANRPANDPDRNRLPVQRRIRVPAARWDSLGLADAELLVMDVQGSELRVLEGFGERLSAFRFIVLEVEPVSSYVGGCTLGELERWLRARGFRLAATDRSGTRIFRFRVQLKLSALLAGLRSLQSPSRLYQGAFNALFVRR